MAASSRSALFVCVVILLVVLLLPASLIEAVISSIMDKTEPEQAEPAPRFQGLPKEDEVDNEPVVSKIEKKDQVAPQIDLLSCLADPIDYEEHVLPPIEPSDPKAYKIPIITLPTLVAQTRRAYVMFAHSRVLWSICFRRAYELRRYGSRYPLICGTLDEVPKDILDAGQALNLTFSQWPSFWSPSKVLPTWFKKNNRWTISWDRFGMLYLHDYDSLVYLDLDTLLTRAPDELFGIGPETVIAHTLGATSCAYPHGLNGGVIVLRPIPELLHEFTKFLDRKRTLVDKKQLFSQSDQTAMKYFLADDLVRKNLLKLGAPMVLSHVYNFSVRNCECERFEKFLHNEVVIYHHTGPIKFWESRTSTEECTVRFITEWWVYFDEVVAWLRVHHPKGLSHLRIPDAA